MPTPEKPGPCPACGYPLEASPCARCGGTVLGSAEGSAIEPGRGFAPTDVIRGFVGFFRGAVVLFHRPEYFGKLKLPMLVNLLVLVAVYLLIVATLWTWFDQLLEIEWGWLEFLRTTASWATAVMSFALAMIASFFLAPVVVETVTAPFLDPLAQQTEVLLGGPAMRPIDQSMWRSVSAGVRASAQILIIQVLVLIPCLLLSLTVIGAMVALIVAALLNALVWFDIPFGRRGYGLRERIAVLRLNWARALGFGLAFQVGALLPLFNIFLLTPTAAVATSSLYFHFSKSRPDRRDPATPS